MSEPKSNATQRSTGQNEGEGNRTAARKFNKQAREFAKSGKVDAAAEKAKEALQGPEREELKEAEAKGREQAREQDPAVVRDYTKPEK
ncbi:MAG: hypothetical protein GEU76_02245 [Alphaproteobacteria bacterium]|nr:hypothetical protein [Alphaproteobacteria bacterium]